MTGSIAKIRIAERQRPIHRTDVQDDDAESGSFAYMMAKSSVRRYRSAAVTLCLLRGAGTIKINKRSIEYHEGKWIEIPDKSEYEILPEADTVMLELPKRTRAFGDAADTPVSPMIPTRSSGSVGREPEGPKIPAW
jgi:hypothetical protein